ncbi:MAG: zinc dependent phospholipase family protein [Chloroflexi bacterium]|nr:zinc dependent phospholipase family protein [Chloroflexota bacterium]
MFRLFSTSDFYNPFYNLAVPTPFYHLSIAEEILKQPDLPGQSGTFLQSHRGAFLLGNTAPDVQTLSGQDRQATHFFDLPIIGGEIPPWSRLLSVYPELTQPGLLSGDQAAFLAGYLCHLQADWNWVIRIFSPVFGPGSHWRNYRHRLYLHNVLRSYLDSQILPELVPHMASDLSQAAPDRWLPFVDDYYLVQWRDLLAGQLCEGCQANTVEVFAARQGVSPQDYYDLLQSEERLELEIFSRLPRPGLVEYRQNLLMDNVLLLANYLEGVGTQIWTTSI